jgi:hypothetical protein
VISLIAFNGGTGIYEFPGLEAAERITIGTPFGTHAGDTRADSAAVAHRRAARMVLRLLELSASSSQARFPRF